MAGTRVKAWDLPVRICHWGFALLLPALWWTAENGQMRWHMRLGLALLALLVFRVLWGFVGSSTARFARFVRGPGAVVAYLRSAPRGDFSTVGHNPAGGWSVLAMLGAMLVQVSLGLFAGDPYDGATGPLNRWVGVMTADALTEWHGAFFYAVLALVAFHLLAVAFYLAIRRDNLVGPMLTGWRSVPHRVDGMSGVPAWRPAACALVAIAAASWVGSGLPMPV